MRRTYPGLDLVRFAAAAYVALFHLTFLAWKQQSSDLQPIGRLFDTGWMGVPIFFVLSGFVIAFSAHGKRATSFVKGRVLRLYPAAWFCAGFSFLAVLGQPDLLPRLLGSLTLWPMGPWIDAAYWTLGVEIVFYACVAIVLATIGSRWLTRLGVALGLASSAYWLGRLADFVTGHHLRPAFDALDSQAGALTLLPNGVQFGIGVLLWSSVEMRPTRAKTALLIAFVAVGLVAAVTAERYKIIIGEGAPVDLIVAAGVWLGGVSLIAGSAFFNDAVAGLRWQSQIRTIGLATYPLYLVHQEVGVRIMRALGGPSIVSLLATLAALAVIVAIVLAGERPVRRLLDRTLLWRRTPVQIA